MPSDRRGRWSTGFRISALHISVSFSHGVPGFGMEPRSMQEWHRYTCVYYNGRAGGCKMRLCAREVRDESGRGGQKIGLMGRARLVECWRVAGVVWQSANSDAIQNPARRAGPTWRGVSCRLPFLCAGAAQMRAGKQTEGVTFWRAHARGAAIAFAKGGCSGGDERSERRKL
jgi:hypothetical protein